ncbi:MAG: rod shape-determining protein RodA, partial [Candidatus Accumulibacter sp.]|nr:rod shape-determining protein RodA [Accumulibacter sp.]
MLQQFLAAARQRLVEHIDPTLLLITLAIMATGLTTVYSATYDANNRLLAQALNMAVGI